MRRINVFLCCFFIFVFSSFPAYSYNSDTIVYVTKTGECYHESGCSYLKSKIEKTLEEAVNGGYRACSRCKPPKLSSKVILFEPEEPDISESSAPSYVRVQGDPYAAEKAKLENELYKLEADIRKKDKAYNELSAQYYETKSSLPGVSVGSFALGATLVCVLQRKK